MGDAIDCALGMRIYRKIRRPAAIDMQRLENASVSDLCDAMRGMGAVDPALAPVFKPMKRVFGPAVTVDLAPGDGMMLRAALDVAEPGDVIVANAHGTTARAIMGGAMALQMAYRGVQGVVVDGAVRDVAEFEALGFPVIARGVSPRSGSTGAGYGEVNVPVACGGVVVHPGDLVVGDQEGLVIIPRAWVAAVADVVGHTDHAPFDPAGIRKRLAGMRPGQPVPGIVRVQAAMEKGGLMVEDVWSPEL